MGRTVTAVAALPRGGGDMIREPGKPRGLTTTERIALTSYLALAGALTLAGTAVPNRTGSSRRARSQRTGVDPDRVAPRAIPDLSPVRPPIDNAPGTGITFRPRWSLGRASWRHRFGGASLYPSTA